MNLKTLLKDVDVVKISGAQRPTEIEHLAINSKLAQPGSLFFALPGKHHSDVEFVQEAFERGAVACVCEHKIPHASHICQIQVRDVRQALGQIANHFYRYPDQDLRLVGVTGTSGKTTTSWILKHLFSKAFAEPTGLLGTIQYELGRRILPATLTTPDALTLASYFREMAQNQLQNVIMEVSSHGIAQQRVGAFHFDTAVFTNLSPEHLDFHQNMKAYFEAKKSFFFQKGLKCAIINVDNPYGQRLLKELPQTVEPITFACHEKATLQAKEIRTCISGTSFKLIYPEGSLKVQLQLPGVFNVYNTLAALAVCYAHGRDLKYAVKALKTFVGVPGRLEKVITNKALSVFVDYAHKPDALQNVLSTLRPMTKGKLHLVFGCGGDRDRLKRPLMAQVAETYADAIWVTNDNPRTEAPEQIFADIRKGFQSPERVMFMEDRAQAIAQAYAHCQEGDCLLIAGKGHESYQEINQQFLPFDDRAIVEACNRKSL